MELKTTQYRAPYERPPPGSPLTYGQTSRGDYTSGSTSTQRTAYMAPRPRQVYGTPLVYHQWQKLTTLFIGGISPGVTDDWMEKILKDL
ncbi:unnamed protein product [Rhizophagus irregularis]|nr:unnamed protein product [Rhizophagus irregularis]